MLRSRTSATAGFTLIEVLVALIVLVLGVLGAAAMTLSAIRDSKQSSLRSQASALAYEISDLMRANPPVYSTAAVPVLVVDTQSIFLAAPSSATAIPTCWTTGCSFANAEMAKNDYYEWYRKLQNTTTGLPGGDAVICRDATMLASYPACDGLATSPIVVKIKWDEKLSVAMGNTASTNATGVTTRFIAVTIQPF